MASGLGLPVAKVGIRVACTPVAKVGIRVAGRFRFQCCRFPFVFDYAYGCA